MATLAVTIGIGDDHRRFAEDAASRVRHHLGLETFIIGESHLSHALELETMQEQIWSLKFSLFDIVPARWDRIMYFDNDWRPVRDWNADLLFPDREVIYVAPARTYIKTNRELETAYGLAPGAYFNAGWMVIPRSAQPLLDEARQRYRSLPKRYADQCVLNQVLAGKVAYVAPAFNVMDIENWPDLANVMAVHSIVRKWNYQVYLGEINDLNWEVAKFADPNETKLRSLDYRHEWTTGVDHIVEVYQVASGYAGGTALDIGSFRGHSALALALAGLEVTSVDTSEKHRRDREGVLARHFLTADFRIGSSRDQLDSPETYDVVMHDASHGDRIRPELEAFWKQKVNPGGLLIVHDVDQIELPKLLKALDPDGQIVTGDERGRQMGYFLKPLASGSRH